MKASLYGNSLPIGCLLALKVGSNDGSSGSIGSIQLNPRFLRRS
jgi:hypothetical protein